MAAGLQNRKHQNIAAFMQYTILFCFLVLLIYGVLIIDHRSFIQRGDSLKQGYFWTVEAKHQLEMLLEGKGLQQWSWSRLQGMSVMTSRYWDPFNWLAAAFPVGYTELGYTAATLLRIYCGGAAFLALMRYTGMSVFAGVFGAAAYAFTGFNMITGLIHAEFLMNIYLFPLLVLSVEMIYKGRSPVWFSLMTGLYIISNFYQAYMGAISVILYILLRYFAYNEFDMKDYAKTTGKFILYGIIGILIGCIQFVPDFAAMSGASVESATDSFGLLFSKYYYMDLAKYLLGTGDVKNYGIIGWTVIVIMLLGVSLTGLRLKNTPAMLTLILFTGILIPAVCSLYNAFSYPSTRWIFSLHLFAAWTAASMLDEKKTFTGTGAAAAVTMLALTSLATLGMNYLFDMKLEELAVEFITIQLAGGAAFAVLLILSVKKGQFSRLSKVMLLVIFTGTMSAAWTLTFIENKDEFFRNNKINKMLQESTQRAGALIEDDSFWRVDQVDSILFKNCATLPPNETLWWQTRSVYGYNSRLPDGLLEFNRLAGNNYGYSRRVAVNSNDNRTGLEYLYGVKYFLGDDLKNDRTGSDEYAGYSFEEYKNIDGVNVFKSKYDVSLGYVFDKYMSKSEFEKLGYAEREQALLQAVVLPDDAAPSAAGKIEAEDVKTAVKDIKYTVAESDGAELADGIIAVEKQGGSITLAPEDFENNQLLVSLTGLLRNVSEGQSESFILTVTNGRVEETADNTFSNQTIPNIKDYNLNLGYYDRYSGGKIKISFSEPGTYHYDDIKLIAMDADLFDECIEELSGGKYEIKSFSDETVEGTVDAEKDGILFLSIVEPENWECLVDGKEAGIIKNTDMAFAGVAVPAGHHSVTLRYRNRMVVPGAILSIAGLTILAISELIRRRRRA